MSYFQRILALALVIGGLFLSVSTTHAQVKTYSFEQIDSLQQVAPRPVFVMIHTDWCRWCQVMKKTTLQDEQVMALLNESYYFVSFDGETKEDITFNGHTFQSRSNSIYPGTHDLALQLGEIDDILSYPALTFLNPAYEITFQHSGFLNKKQFRKVLGKIRKQE